MDTNGARTIPWLSDLAEIPTEGTWPRLMSGPHPRATGSYGAWFTAWVKMFGRWPLWWWQELAATRLLEHDEDGRLVWRVAALTTSRQCGKSYLLSMLALWRITKGAEIFGEPQTCLHVSKDLNTSREVQRPARTFGRERPDDYKVRENGGQVEIEHLDSGSLWLLRSAAGVFGHSASLAIVDECWALRPEVIDDNLSPTMAQRMSPQLLLVSTANPRATSLMISRRAGALSELDDEANAVLWLEWSADPDDELDDEEAWRAASPQWDDKRRQEVARAHASAEATLPDDPTVASPLASFESQWLNRWPAAVEPRRQRGEPLLDLEAWQACEQDEHVAAPLVLAVEDYFGAGACFVLADEDRRRSQDLRRGAGVRQPRRGIRPPPTALLNNYGCSRLIVGASLEKDPRAVKLELVWPAAARPQSGYPSCAICWPKAAWCTT